MSKRWPQIVLVVMLMGAIFGCYLSSRSITYKQENSFYIKADKTRDLVQARFNSYLEALYGTQALFMSSQSVERDEWHTFVSTIQLQKRYPGIQAIRYIERVPNDQLDAFIAGVRSDKSLFPNGYPDFIVYPVEAQAEYFVVKYVEPFEGNQPMLGFNLGSDPMRREALFRARDTGMPAVSGITELITDAYPPKKGFMVNLPVFRSNFRVPSAENRNESLIGFVGIVLAEDEFFLDAVKVIGSTPGLYFKIQDKPGLKEKDRDKVSWKNIVDKARPFTLPPRFYTAIPLFIADREWKMEFYATKEFEKSPLYSVFSWLVFLLGASCSFLVYFFMLSLQRSETKAVLKVKDISLKLSEKEIYLEQLIQNAPDPIIVLDLLGFVKEMNPAAEKISGYRSQEIVGKHFSQTGVLTETSLIRTVQEFTLIAAGKERPPFELDLIRKDSTRFAVEAHANRLDLDRQPPKIQVIIRDITDRKKLQTQLAQVQKMETIGVFSGGIAHDLNNQLSPVLGYISMVLKDLGESHPSYVFLVEAQQSANRCKEIIQRLMNFSRGSPHKKEPVSIRALMEETKKMASKLLPSTIQFSVEAEPNLPQVLGNENELETVILNMCANARDAMPEGGHLAVRAKKIEELKRESDIHTAFNGPYVCLIITDNGMGISPDIIQKIYEPFFTTKEKGKGTGLGLAMVFNIIKDHGGWIEVSSDIGKGTSFHIYLPAIKDSKDTGEFHAGKKESITPPKWEGTVLFVDDEDYMRKFGKTLLERLGFHALLAADGVEAVEQYAAHKEIIKFVITDMTMPKQTGRDTMEKILKINPKALIIVMSGFTDEGTPEELIRAGAKDYLQKPFTLAILAESIKKMLG